MFKTGLDSSDWREKEDQEAKGGGREGQKGRKKGVGGEEEREGWVFDAAKFLLKFDICFPILAFHIMRDTFTIPVLFCRPESRTPKSNEKVFVRCLRQSWHLCFTPQEFFS